MKLQKATCFALFAVLELAAEPTRQRAAGEIAEKYGISLHHLAKVLRDLGRAGFVESARGVGGGYRLAGNPKRVTLLDVIEVFEQVADGKGGDEPRPTTDVGRGLRIVLDEIDEHALATLRSVSLATMLKIIQRPAAAAASDKKPRRQAARG